MKKKMLCAALIVALCLSSCGKGVDLDQPGYGKWLKRFADLASDWEGRNQDGADSLSCSGNSFYGKILPFMLT